MCEFIDTVEDYFENFSNNLQEVDSHEIAEKILLALKAVAMYMMKYSQDEMFLFSSIAYGIAEFLDRTGEHTPQKLTSLLEKISNKIKTGAAVWNKAGEDIDMAIEDMDEQFEDLTDVWADKIDKYITNFDFDFCYSCLLINGVVSIALSFSIAHNPIEFWLEAIKTFACNFAIQIVVQLLFNKGNNHLNEIKERLTHMFDNFKNYGKDQIEDE